MDHATQRSKSTRSTFFSLSLAAILLATTSTLGGPVTARHGGCELNEIGDHADAWVHVCGGVTFREETPALMPHTHEPEMEPVCPVGPCVNVPKPLTILHLHPVSVQLAEAHGHVDVNHGQVAEDVCAILSDICAAIGDLGIIDIENGGTAIVPASTVPGGPVDAWALSVDGTVYVFPWADFPGIA